MPDLPSFGPRKMRRGLLIFPYNGSGLEAVDCLDEQWDLIGFVDDTPTKQGIGPYGHPIYSREAFDRWRDAMVLAVPGSPTSYLSRQRIIEGLAIDASRWAQVVHPGARVSRLATLGRNVLVMAGTVITSNARIGNHVCVLPNSVIHHDAEIGDWTLIGAGVVIAGQTAIGQNCYVGAGSHIMNGVTVGSRAIVGLGANVVRDVKADTRVAGNPARSLNSDSTLGELTAVAKAVPELPFTAVLQGSKTTSTQ